MELRSAAENILTQLESLVVQTRQKDFVEPSATLNHATIGQHVRHILEFFICLESGVHDGKVNYDNRNHDKSLETSKSLTLQTIKRIRDFVGTCTSDYNLLMEGNFEEGAESQFQVKSNYQRELVYNIEHAIHHMALIKIGVKENADYVKLPPDFGVASSTIRYLNTN